MIRARRTAGLVGSIPRPRTGRAAAVALRTIAVAVVLAAAGAALAAPAAAADWPQYQHDAAHTGVTTAPGPGANASLVWRDAPPRGVGSSVAVREDRAYVGTLSGDYLGTVDALQSEGRSHAIEHDGGVRAFDPASGEVLWRRDTNGSVWATPAVGDGTVHVATVAGIVHALDASDGGQRWRFDAGAPVFASTLADGTLYLGTRDYDAHTLARANSTVYALDAEDGAVRWRHGVEEGVFAPPAVADGTVYVGSQNGSVHALDADTGAVQWTAETRGEPGHNDPMVANGAVAGAPTVVDGTVYVPSYAGVVYAADADTGRPLWRHDTGARIASSPAVADGTVYVGDYGARLRALDAADGDSRWVVRTPGAPSKSSPALADGTLYIGTRGGFGSRAGQVAAFAAEDGERLWNASTPRWVLSSPAVSGETVYLASLDAVHALGPVGDGAPLDTLHNATGDGGEAASGAGGGDPGGEAGDRSDTRDGGTSERQSPETADPFATMAGLMAVVVGLFLAAAVAYRYHR